MRCARGPSLTYLSAFSPGETKRFFVLEKKALSDLYENAFKFVIYERLYEGLEAIWRLLPDTPMPGSKGKIKWATATDVRILLAPFSSTEFSIPALRRSLLLSPLALSRAWSGSVIIIHSRRKTHSNPIHGIEKNLGQYPFCCRILDEELGLSYCQQRMEKLPIYDIWCREKVVHKIFCHLRRTETRGNCGKRGM